MAFTKMEGTTVNIKDKIAYSAMSRIEKSMTTDEYDVKVAQASILASNGCIWDMRPALKSKP